MKTSTVYAVQAVDENYGRAVVRLFADADAAGGEIGTAHYPIPDL